jgi:hypothetical protein
MGEKENKKEPHQCNLFTKNEKWIKCFEILYFENSLTINDRP